MTDNLDTVPARKLKDWYDAAMVSRLADRFATHVPRFSRSKFLKRATHGLTDLEMLDRVRLIAQAMEESFPGPAARDMPALIACMDLEEGVSSMELWPFGEFIGRRGLDDWQAAWPAMDELTQRLTSEFAVRPFLAADLKRALAMLKARLAHPSEHVRRWVSEGTRTRLPWAKAVPGLRKVLDARLELLEALKDDPSLYVRRSVANHLQDILKDDPEPGLEVLERWAALKSPDVDWVVRHAARGLLKAGHPRVLALFGWNQPVRGSDFTVGPTALRMGDSAELSLRVHNPGKERVGVRLDYGWEGPTHAGRRFRKVFRWTELQLSAGGSQQLSKRHPFVERSIRKLPFGDYTFTVLLNGQAGASQTVVLGP